MFENMNRIVISIRKINACIINYNLQNILQIYFTSNFVSVKINSLIILATKFYKILNIILRDELLNWEE